MLIPVSGRELVRYSSGDQRVVDREAEQQDDRDERGGETDERPAHPGPGEDAVCGPCTRISRHFASIFEATRALAV
jgi:hypothetical protein